VAGQVPESTQGQDAGPQVSFYDAIGGHDTFVRLVDAFYQGVATDEVLRPMYPDDLGPANDRMRMFLEQYWGGPTTYSDQRGHPRLRMRHAPFAVNGDARDRWLSHMRAAVDTLNKEYDASALDTSQLNSEELKRAFDEVPECR